MKKMIRVLNVLAVGSAVLYAFGISGGLALGVPQPPLPNHENLEASSSPSSPESAGQMPGGEPLAQSQTFTSEGQVYGLGELGLSLTPPKGWEVTHGMGGPTLVIKEPSEKNPVYGEPTYQRNITVAVIHTPSPIDEKRAKELEAQLVQNFSKDGVAQDFKILEHKFFNYKSENDGLLVYSSMTVNSFPMMQMHILLGGDKKQFLFTYSDLEKRFSTGNDPAYQEAWNTIVGSQVDGNAPTRMSLYRPHMTAGFLLTLISGSLVFLRLRAKRRDFNGEADRMLDAEDDETLSSFGSALEPAHPATAPRGTTGQKERFSGFSAFSSFQSLPLSAHSVDFASHV